MEREYTIETALDAIAGYLLDVTRHLCEAADAETWRERKAQRDAALSVLQVVAQHMTPKDADAYRARLRDKLERATEAIFYGKAADFMQAVKGAKKHG